VPPLPRPARAGLALLALGPIAVMPGALNRFVFLKLAVVAAGVAVAALRPGLGRLPRPALAGVGAAALLLVAAALAGAAPLVQLVGRGPRYEGLPVLGLYAAAAAAGAALLGPAPPRARLSWFLDVLSVAVLFVSLFAIVEAAGLRPLSSSSSRPGGLFGNASDEGAFAVLVAGPLAVLGFALRRRLVLAGAAGATATAALSGSRGALAALLGVAVLTLAVTRGRHARTVVVAGLVAALAVALAVPSIRHRVTGQSALARHTVSGRVLLWRETLRLIASHPVLGVGPNGFEDAITAEHSLRWQQQVGPENPPDSPHDWLLQAAAAGGIPLLLLALAALVWVAVVGVRRALRERAERAPPVAAALLTGLAGYAGALLVHFTSPGPTMLAAVFAGALVCSPTPVRAPSAPQRSSPAPQRSTPARKRAKRTVTAKPTAEPVGAWRIWVVLGSSLLALVWLFAAVAEIPLRSAIVDVTGARLSAANAQFHDALRLRPWDIEVRLAAGHAFAAAALDGLSGASSLGRPWLTAPRTLLPDSEQVDEDLAALDAAAGDFTAADRLLDRALARDRHNPELLLRRGVVEAQSRQLAAAERDFLAAAVAAPRSSQPWTDLATLYRLENKPALAAQAAKQATERSQ
jgi:O-antigen ligase